jgi:hypothetical protein
MAVAAAAPLFVWLLPLLLLPLGHAFRCCCVRCLAAAAVGAMQACF